MERWSSAVRRPSFAWGAWWRVPGLAAGLLLVERELVRLAGMPNEQLRTLQLAVRAPADPVAPVIALLAVMAEGLVGYVLALLVLRSLSLLTARSSPPRELPGIVARVAWASNAPPTSRRNAQSPRM